MKRALRIALHPVVLILLAIDVVGITLLVISPSWGYRATVTYGSMCPFINYCYRGHPDDDTVPESNPKKDDDYFGDMPLSLNCRLVKNVSDTRESGEDQWLRCAARCTGTCDQVEECTKQCSDDMLVYGHRESCGEDLGRNPPGSRKSDYLSGKYERGELRTKMGLFLDAKFCESIRNVDIANRARRLRGE